MIIIMITVDIDSVVIAAAGVVGVITAAAAVVAVHFQCFSCFSFRFAFVAVSCL